MFPHLPRKVTVLRCHKQADGVIDLAVPVETIGQTKDLGKWLSKHGLP